MRAYVRGMRVRACYTFSCTSVFILYACQSRFFFLLCSPFRGVFGKRAVLATVLTQPFVGTNSRNKSLPKPNIFFAGPVFTAVIKTARRKGIISVTMVLLKGHFWSFPPVPSPRYAPPPPNPTLRPFLWACLCRCGHMRLSPCQKCCCFPPELGVAAVIHNPFSVCICTRAFSLLCGLSNVSLLGLLAHLHATFVLRQEVGDIAELNTAEWEKKVKCSNAGQ